MRTGRIRVRQPGPHGHTARCVTTLTSKGNLTTPPPPSPLSPFLQTINCWAIGISMVHHCHPLYSPKGLCVHKDSSTAALIVTLCASLETTICLRWHFEEVSRWLEIQGALCPIHFVKRRSSRRKRKKSRRVGGERRGRRTEAREKEKCDLLPNGICISW